MNLEVNLLVSSPAGQDKCLEVGSDGGAGEVADVGRGYQGRGDAGKTRGGGGDRR